ncbi:hypothetical protein VaNZ11_008702 [Volvox africanus]|uniref:SET domain-containing protein n=1 Tax=Volvox africanus TaxID=51714 RepID=A0ABQ5S5W2_9CHLO|nr:hypothetical protein VaNZ11_008702 [Volvox africanus]
MSTFVRLGLVAFSAGVAALVVALVMPYTDPRSLAALANHPIGAKVLNLSTSALHSFARLLEGVSPSASVPSLHHYHPLSANDSKAAQTATSRGAIASRDLDWADQRVWQLQQSQVTSPFYTEDELSRLLHWCGRSSSTNHDIGSPAVNYSRVVSSTATMLGREAPSSEEMAVNARFDRLARWVAASGGDASKVQLGVDGDGLRGLHANCSIGAGEVVLAVPLKVGLSAATFRAAQVLAGPTSAWRSFESADVFLDALVVSYEVAVHGDRSPWADYLCLLPRSYEGLPVHISDPWVASLLSELPALRRLVAKRRAQLALFANDLARPALMALPGGRSAMLRLARSRGDSAAEGSGGRDLWLPLWHWAYAAVKTRSVTLAAEDVRHGDGGDTLPGGQLPLRLPHSMLDWVQEYGMLLPILDMANHAFEGRGANVAYQLLPDASGTGLAAALVALRPLSPGQPLLFDYVSSAELEEGPACLERWLLEYGFVPNTADSDPARDCDTFEVTATDIARAVARTATSEPLAGTALTEMAVTLEHQIAERLSRRAMDGLPARLEIHVRQPYEDQQSGTQDHVAQRWAVLQWLKAALWDTAHEDGRAPESGSESKQPGNGARDCTYTGKGEEQHGGRTGFSLDLVNPRNVLKTLLQGRLEQLGELEHRAIEGTNGAPCTAAAEVGKRAGACASTLSGASRNEKLRRGLLAVAAAGRRAVQRALDQELKRQQTYGIF